MGTFVGAYWGVRAESVEGCAERVARLLPLLADIDPLLGGWRDKATTKREALAQPIVTADRDELVERLQRGLLRDDNRRAEGTGFSAFWWNGHSSKDGGATLNVTNIGSTNARLPRAVVVNVPDKSQSPQLYTAPAARKIVAALIDTVEPDRAVWLDDTSRDAQTEPDRTQADGSVVLGKLVGHPAGWATYLGDSEPTQFDRDLLPASATIERIGSGTLVLLGDDPASPSRSDVLAVRAAMGYETAAVEAPASSPLSAIPGSVSGAPDGETREREVRTDADVDARGPQKFEQP